MANKRQLNFKHSLTYLVLFHLNEQRTKKDKFYFANQTRKQKFL